MRHLIFFLIGFLSINSQAHDAKTILTIYDLPLTQSEACENLLVLYKYNGNRGGKNYAERAAAINEKYLMALESDRGGFSPREFSINCSKKQLNGIKKWIDLFELYSIHEFKTGNASVDINHLEDVRICLIGLSPDSQKYFDHHHSYNDIFEEVNKRELVLGAASITSLIFTIDKYWTIYN